MKEITKDQAIELSKSKFWEKMSYEEISIFQISEDKLCIPFNIFHVALEKTLGRSVYTLEFELKYDDIKKEILRDRKPLTYKEIVNLIPKENRSIILS